MPEPRVVAGLSCLDVLADLSAFVDGELDDARAAAIVAHLQGCDWCERFGGRFGDLLAALRSELGPPEPVPDAVAARLDAALAALD
jgi:anti-sigma factor RsiW